MKNRAKNLKAKPDLRTDTLSTAAPKPPSWFSAPGLEEALARRDFLKLMGASLALAGMAGCRRPVEKIVPYMATPEEVVQGHPNYYATTMPLGLHAFGLVVESHEGRPTKIEGNPLHPATPAGSQVLMQAAILSLYDPDRSRQVMRQNAAGDWAEFTDFWRSLESGLLASQGSDLAILSESFSAPTLARLKASLQNRFPRSTWVTYEPVSEENILAGIRLATDRSLRPVYHFDQARVMLALEADFLQREGEPVRQAYGFAAGRQVRSPGDEMSRLYVVESAYSLTGAMADHRLSLPGHRLASVLAALCRELAARGVDCPGKMVSSPVDLADLNPRSVAALTDDLTAHRGSSLLLAGSGQPPEVHALILALNAALGNVGSTITYHEIADSALPQRADLPALVEQMKSGAIKTLVILGGNPVYNAPVDLEFKSALDNIETSFHLSLYQDETSQACRWHLPQAHFLECWGDARAADGTASVIQPMIAPLFGGRSAPEVLHFLATGSEQSGYDIVRQTWQNGLLPDNFNSHWRQVLHDGLLAESSAPAIVPRLEARTIEASWQSCLRNLASDDKAKLELVFLPDARVWDGRFANNAWLQELPDPITKITWDNAVLISPRTAAAAGLESGDIIKLRFRDRELSAPVWVQPGQADQSLTLSLGYGREAGGQVGTGVGCNAYRLRLAQNPDILLGVKIEKTGEKHAFAVTQEQRDQAGRPLARSVALEEYRQNPQIAGEVVEIPPLQSLWKEHEYSQTYQWGMAIDLNLCTGCGACAVACMSENNIPVVGKEQIARGREMHWLRIDAYYSGDQHHPEMIFQPVACQHCEMAPCEQVCPVAATVHSAEGLNLMTYNRCVGTRYCSNNCPYKVRRFNFFNYTKDYPELLKMLQNPDVTVRSRGVMEKCTYCLQRLTQAKRTARNAGREMRDGEVLTACQQACPTGAIVFGNVRDPASRVALLKRHELNYQLLAEFNTRPRTSYLARIKNPNVKLGA